MRAKPSGGDGALRFLMFVVGNPDDFYVKPIFLMIFILTCPASFSAPFNASFLTSTRFQAYYPTNSHASETDYEISFHIPSCSLKYSSPKTEKNRAMLLDPESCKNLARLLQSSSEKKPKQRSPEYAPLDSPNYRLKLATENFWRELKLRAPGICAITPSGELNCKEQKLDASEELLIELRDYARRLSNAK